jgi:hypothetical protein
MTLEKKDNFTPGQNRTFLNDVTFFKAEKKRNFRDQSEFSREIISKQILPRSSTRRPKLEAAARSFSELSI